MISQKSIFVRSPTGIIDENHVEIVSIPGKLKREAVEYLKKLHGITTETIYNDLLGYIRNQERHHTAYAEYYIDLLMFKKGNEVSHFAQRDNALEVIDHNVISAVYYKNRGTAKAELGVDHERRSPRMMFRH